VLSTDERAELVAEGLAILCKLAHDYKPHIARHARNEGRFSGYAANPEHQLRTQPDGRRRA
jgi:hypothetical protein